MYLLDTNIILELLLDQDRAEQVERFLRNTPPEQLYLSEFSLYSLGIILFRHREHDAFLQIVEDLLVVNRIRLIRLGEAEMQSVVRAAQRFNLDFDDAYQYVAAELSDAVIVSFDGDFDRTDRGRQTPKDVLSAEEAPEA
jgi:predicted nucleic acid-binding protein